VTEPIKTVDMSKRVGVAGFRHRSSSMSDGEFFRHIDECGGWRHGYEFVGFSHTEGRQAGFCNSPKSDEFWTVLASVDDYYIWKLSPEALQHLTECSYVGRYFDIRDI
jgi:hypothetical protein